MAYEPKEWECGETVNSLALNNMENAIAMANSDYVPHEWECGEVITADLLNHIEQGIADASSGGASYTKHTYTGTVANIMSQLPNYSAFAEVLFNGSAFARLTATLGTDTATLTVVSSDGQLVHASLQFLTTNPTITNMATYIAQWDSIGTLNVFEQISNANDNTWRSTNYKPMASQVPCTLEVVFLD